MIVDNGQRLPLTIQGVFDGICGVSRGVVAFTPNRIGKQAGTARAGILDGEPVLLSDVRQAEDGRSYTARFQVF